MPIFMTGPKSVTQKKVKLGNTPRFMYDPAVGQRQSHPVVLSPNAFVH